MGLFSSLKKLTLLDFLLAASCFCISYATMSWLLNKPQDAAYIGDWLSGFASLLAFTWLIAGFHQQTKELQLQRQDLDLQRRSLNAQLEEFKSMNKISTLAAVEKILKVGVQKFKEANNGMDSPTELISKFMINPSWTTIFNSKDPHQVLDAWQEWLKIQTSASQFLNCLNQALLLYLDLNGTKYDVKYKFELTFDFFMIHSVWIKNTPYFSDYYHIGTHLSEMFCRLDRGLKSIELAGLTAMALTSPIEGLVKEDGLKDLYTEAKKEDRVPPVCELYDFETQIKK